MKTIYDYNCYHSYIKDFYQEKRKDEFYFSYLYIALQLDLDLFEVIDIFSGKEDIPTGKESEFADILGLNNVEKAFFKRLIYNSKTEKNTAYTADTVNTLFTPYNIAS